MIHDVHFRYTTEYLCEVARVQPFGIHNNLYICSFKHFPLQNVSERTLLSVRNKLTPLQ